MATMGPRRPHDPRYRGPSMIQRPELNPHLTEALLAWLADFDDGWGDRGESREAENGGYAQKSHGDEHIDKVFDLIRIARRTFRHDPDGHRDGEPWPPEELLHYKALDDLPERRLTEVVHELEAVKRTEGNEAYLDGYRQALEWVLDPTIDPWDGRTDG